MNIANLFPNDFQSRELTKEELEQMVRDAVKKEYSVDNIKSITYNKDGVKVTLHNGETIDIEIDWDEFVLE